MLQASGVDTMAVVVSLAAVAVQTYKDVAPNQELNAEDLQRLLNQVREST